MTNPNTKNGITKDSTLVINVPPYLPNNYTQILNHVGYWKWNPTLSQFDEGSQNDYNLLVQPLWFDADSGLPQKIRIDSSDTKRLKLENNNQDRSSEVVEYLEPSQNNLMVRFNTKTRSVTEYPYFEVESIPPTITNPVTSNGYYKFDGNTLISGTNQDHNIYINVNYSVSKIVATGLNSSFQNTSLIIADNNTNSDWTFYSTSTRIRPNAGSEMISIRKVNGFYLIKIWFDMSSTLDYSDANAWLYMKDLSTDVHYLQNIDFKNSNNEMLISGNDYNNAGDDKFTSIKINEKLINFDSISWMTFN